MKSRGGVIPAGQFKAQCLAILDRVNETGEPVIVTKRGRPVAQVVPIERPRRRSLRGSITYHGDIVAPIDVEWDATR
jgi:prevent-host-death family protein